MFELLITSWRFKEEYLGGNRAIDRERVGSWGKEE